MALVKSHKVMFAAVQTFRMHMCMYDSYASVGESEVGVGGGGMVKFSPGTMNRPYSRPPSHHIRSNNAETQIGA